ncbi:MAG: glycoside hydrolase family 97 C-terminal domain-containing protein [Phycisphaerae bacterium]|nr:glycoside hydrolase family 97 C-terminal domain-containing protein [Phycisphaerae bacterium]
MDVPVSFVGQSRCTMTVIEDGKAQRTFDNETKAVTAQDHLEVRLQPYGGFVATLSPTR